MTILDLDAGNTRVKWRTSGEGEVAQGALARLDTAILPPADLVDTRRVRVSSVAGAAWNESLRALVHRELGIEVEFARVAPKAGGVTCGYDAPATLGVDRWMAILGARQRCGTALMVIDCGTAITVDVVAAKGAHNGGYIVPGLKLMVGALGSDTAGIEAPSVGAQADLTPGRQTVDAVQRGIVRMLADFLDAAVARFQHQCDDRGHIFVCGGDADIIAPHIATSKVVIPGLVLDGLAVALP